MADVWKDGREATPASRASNTNSFTDEFVESIENSVDRMRDEGGMAPEVPHTQGRAEEIQAQLRRGGQ